MESQLRKPRGRYAVSADNRRVQERTRRILRPGALRRPRDLRPVRHHVQQRRHVSLRTGILGRRWQELGSELDRHRHTPEAMMVLYRQIGITFDDPLLEYGFLRRLPKLRAVLNAIAQRSAIRRRRTLQWPRNTDELG